MPNPASVRQPALRTPLLAVAAALCWLTSPGALLAGEKTEGTKKYALLVGCTQYQNCPNIPPLDGPANDGPRFAGVLDKLGFPKANITQLAGWPKDVSKRPSYANIIAGFENLVKKAGPDTQIFILLAGHGDQTPIPSSRKEPVKPRTLKLDGMDRVFLPADVNEWQDDKLDNAILDDTIGNYLDKMAEKGAAVWIVLDCCHSGTMARDISKNDVERMREVPKGALKIPPRAFEEAAKRAKVGADGAKTRSVGMIEPGMLQLSPRKGLKGSVVAFYACQSYEKAPELVRPRGEAAVAKNYYGLLSWTLTNLLQTHAKAKLTYRELAQMLVATYQAERGSRGPTPFAEGDLDREVLGMKAWPGRSLMTLDRAEGKLRIVGGGVVTLTPNSILAVYPPKDDPRDQKTPVGHVKVVAVTAFQADVEPCAHGKLPAVQGDKLPARARCQVVAQDLGDLKLKIAVGKKVGTAGKPAGPEEAKRRANLAAALKILSDAMKQEVLLLEDQAKADWVLWLEGDKLELHQADGRASIDPREEALLKKAAAEGKPVTRFIYGKYNADNPEEMAKGLRRDLLKIFTWGNVWRVAGTVSGKEAAEGDLKFEIRRLKELTPKGKRVVEGVLDPGVSVRPGQLIELRLSNNGSEDLWVTVLFLDGNCAIRKMKFPRALRAGDEFKPFVGRISQKSHGKEGFIVLAVPQKHFRDAPDFEYLEQEGLEVEEVTRDNRRKSAEESAKTPFQQLMAGAAFGNDRTRSFEPEATTNPTVLSWSWRTMAATPGAPKPK